MSDVYCPGLYWNGLCGARANSITNTSASSKSKFGVISCVRGLCRTDFLKIEKSVSFWCYFKFITKSQNLLGTCETKWQFLWKYFDEIKFMKFRKKFRFLPKILRKICVKTRANAQGSSKIFAVFHRNSRENWKNLVKSKEKKENVRFRENETSNTKLRKL